MNRMLIKQTAKIIGIVFLNSLKSFKELFIPSTDTKIIPSFIHISNPIQPKSGGT